MGYWEQERGGFQEVLLFFCHAQLEEWYQSPTEKSERGPSSSSSFGYSKFQVPLRLHSGDIDW